jgi:hypothetical protein
MAGLCLPDTSALTDGGKGFKVPSEQAHDAVA